MSTPSDSTILSPNPALGAQMAPIPPSPGAPPAPRKTRRRRRVEGLRVALALLMGLTSWMVIEATRTGQAAVEATLSWQTPPAGWQFTRPPPASVRVWLWGSRQNMASLPRTLSFEVPQTLVPPEETGDLIDRIVNFKDDVRTAGVLPESISIVRFEPDTATVQFSRTLDYSLTVEADLRGSPAEHFVAEWRASPDKVFVSGPKQEMDRLAASGPRVLTETIDITGRNTTESHVVRLLPPAGEGVALRTETVHVTVEITEAPVVRRIERVPVRLLLSAWDEWAGHRGGLARARIDPPHVAVTIEGSRIAVESLTPELITVYVRPDMMWARPDTPGVYTARLLAVPPSGTVGAARLEPDEVNWIIEE